MTPPIYHFDVLPLHPPPAPLESFTSYLMRLAAANGITRPCDLGHRLFPEKSPYTMLHLSDHLPLTFGVLPRASCCSEGHLLATTFYHLARKFGRPARGTSLCNFLNGTIALYLRYCPLCLGEHPYYRLPWRFLPLVGCPQHRCRLLDRCGRCGHQIPLLPAALRVGTCPSCHHLLQEATICPLSPEEQQQSAQLAQDLSFLLAPQPRETDDGETCLAVGRLFERLRWKRGLSPAGVSRLSGLDASGIRYLERGKTGGVGFGRYLRYAGFMGVSLKQLFLDELEGFEPLPACQPTREMELAASLQTAIVQLQAENRPIDSVTLRRLPRSSKETSYRYPASKAMLAEVRASAEQQRQEALLERVRQVVEQLQAEGRPVYLAEVSRALNRKSRFLREHPLIGEYLRQLSPPLLEQPDKGEGPMLARVQEALRILGQTGAPFTNTDIADHLGMVMPNLYRHPKVRQLLRQRTAAGCDQEQSRMLELVRAALAQLEANGQPITWQAVSASTGLSWRNLQRFPQVRDLVTRRREVDRTQEKEDRMNRVRQAIQHLKQNGLPATQKAICKTAGLGQSAPSHHPELFSLIQPALAEEKQQREQQVREQVAEALRLLLSANQPVTLPAVAEMVGLPEQQLGRIPQARTLVSQAKIESRERYEDDLVRRIQLAVEELQTAGVPPTQNNICAKIGKRRVSLSRYGRVKAAIDQIAIPYHQSQGTTWGTRHHSAR